MDSHWNKEQTKSPKFGMNVPVRSPQSSLIERPLSPWSAIALPLIPLHDSFGRPFGDIATADTLNNLRLNPSMATQLRFPQRDSLPQELSFEELLQRVSEHLDHTQPNRHNFISPQMQQPAFPENQDFMYYPPIPTPQVQHSGNISDWQLNVPSVAQNSLNPEVISTLEYQGYSTEQNSGHSRMDSLSQKTSDNSQALQSSRTSRASRKTSRKTATSRAASSRGLKQRERRDTLGKEGLRDMSVHNQIEKRKIGLATAKRNADNGLYWADTQNRLHAPSYKPTKKRYQRETPSSRTSPGISLEDLPPEKQPRRTPPPGDTGMSQRFQVGN